MPRVELIYDHSADGRKGVPPVQDIASALGSGGARAHPGAAGRDRSRWRILASLPGIGAALLPVGMCPACWPAYAGILGSLGLGFLLESTYLLAVTVGFVGLALFALACRARSRRGYRPLALGIASVCFVLAFKFAYAFDPLVYVGLSGLVAASAWNAWPKKKREVGSCPGCVRQETAIETKNVP